MIETPSAPEIWLRLAHQGIYVRRFAWSERHLRIGRLETARLRPAWRVLSCLERNGQPGRHEVHVVTDGGDVLVQPTLRIPEGPA